jgi:guanylate kinase
MVQQDKRLRARKTESEESLQRRLDRAKTEMRDAEAPGVFDHIIVNKDLQMAYQKLRATVTQELGLAKKKTSPNTTAAKS